MRKYFDFILFYMENKKNKTLNENLYKTRIKSSVNK